MGTCRGLLPKINPWSDIRPRGGGVLSYPYVLSDGRNNQILPVDCYVTWRKINKGLPCGKRFDLTETKFSSPQKGVLGGSRFLDLGRAVSTSFRPTTDNG